MRIYCDLNLRKMLRVLFAAILIISGGTASETAFAIGASQIFFNKCDLKYPICQSIAEFLAQPDTDIDSSYSFDLSSGYLVGGTEGLWADGQLQLIETENVSVFILFAEQEEDCHKKDCMAIRIGAREDGIWRVYLHTPTDGFIFISDHITSDSTGVGRSICVSSSFGALAYRWGHGASRLVAIAPDSNCRGGREYEE